MANSNTVGAITIPSETISGAATLSGSSYSLTDSGTITYKDTTGTTTGADTVTLNAINPFTGAVAVEDDSLNIAGMLTATLGNTRIVTLGETGGAVTIWCTNTGETPTTSTFVLAVVGTGRVPGEFGDDPSRQPFDLRCGRPDQDRRGNPQPPAVRTPARAPRQSRRAARSPPSARVLQNASSALVFGNGANGASDAPSVFINETSTVDRTITVGSAAYTGGRTQRVSGRRTTPPSEASFWIRYAARSARQLLRA